MTSKPGQQTTAIHILTNISRNKGPISNHIFSNISRSEENQAMKFGQLIRGNLRNFSKILQKMMQRD